MKLIVSHITPDFDALASMALAKLLHPGAVAALLGNLSSQERAFVHLYRDALAFVKASDIKMQDVSELIVVDTSDPRRIAPFETLIGKVPITLYDHHPRPDTTIPAARGLHRQVGATATLLTLLLADQQIPIPPEIASLALLGIHEDTGHLCYGLTTPEDHQAAAQLLRAGASLEIVQSFSQDQLMPEHRELLHELLEHAEEQLIGTRRVVVCRYQGDTYLPGVAPLANQLLELFGSDAVLLGLSMEGKSLLIARAKAHTIDVGSAFADTLEEGGGHPSAAFARSDLPLETTLGRVLEAFAQHVHAGKSAAALMSSPVKTVRADTSVADAQALLSRYSHNGLPVVNAEGTLIGMVSRRDLDRALRQGMAHSEVAKAMSKPVVTATKETSQRELERLIQQHNIGRVPIVQGGELVGIVTRSDLIGAMHAAPSAQASLADTVLNRLPNAASQVLEAARAQLPRGTLYLVGGTVRDALLGSMIKDLDVMVEGFPAEVLGRALKAKLGGKLQLHSEFGTCSLTLPHHLVLDLASAREEIYPHPGALPKVSRGTLRRDLARRDFTINALAVRVAPLPHEVIDPFGGLGDIERRALRTLHPLSFIEDPTRILRGARLAGRLGFHFPTETLEQIHTALESDALRRISGSRLKQELLLSLGEARVTPIIELLKRAGALQPMFGSDPDIPLLADLDEARQSGDAPEESALLVLLMGVPDSALARHQERFHWSKQRLHERQLLLSVQRQNTLPLTSSEALSDAAKAVIRQLSPALRAQLEHLEAVSGRKKLRGRDVLSLGLPSGPAVGDVLGAVAKARAKGHVDSFEDELELAKTLVEARQGAQRQDQESS